jgi:hypothetical protein
MSRRQESAVSRHLPWLFAQGALFTPMVIGLLWSSEPLWVPGLVLGIALAAWLGCAMACNALRLFRAEASEANRGTVLAQGIVGGLFGLFCAINVYPANDDLIAINEAEHMPLAFTSGALALVLLSLATRDAMRLAGRDRQAVA